MSGSQVITHAPVEARNKALVEQFLAAWNSGDLAVMSACWSPEMVHHTRTGTYRIDEVFALISGFMESFPDLTFEIASIVAEGDFVCTRMTARATHRGEFIGIPATGRQISCTVMGIVRIADGRIVEHWNVMDELHFLNQVGLIPDAYLGVMASS